MINKKIILLLCVLIIQPFCLYSYADSDTIITAIEDTYVINTFPTAPYGSATELLSCETISTTGLYDSYEEQKQISEIYMKFDLSVFSEKITNIVFTTFIHNYAGTTGAIYKVSDDNWSEASMTWDSRASRVETPLITLSVQGSSNTNDFREYSWNSQALTKYFQDEQNGDRIASIVIKRLNSKTDNDQGFRIKSKEYTTDNSLIPTIKVTTAKGSLTIGTPVFKNGGNVISEIAGGSITAEAIVENSSSSLQNATMIMAHYEEKSMKQVVKSETVSVERFNGRETFYQTINLPSVTQASSIRLFFWDSLSLMRPLSNQTILNSGGIEISDAVSTASESLLTLNSPVYKINSRTSNIEAAITGNLSTEKNQKVSIAVYKPDGEFAVLEDLHFIDQTLTTQDGNFTFDFTFTDTDGTGEYLFYIGAENLDVSGPYTVKKISDSDLRDCIDAFEEKSVTEIKNLINEKGLFYTSLAFMGADLNAYNLYADEEIKDYIINSLLENKGLLTIKNTGTVFNDFMVTKAVNTAVTSTIHSVLLNFNNILNLDIVYGSKYYLLNNGQNVPDVDNYLINKNYTSISEITTDFNTALFNARAKIFLEIINVSVYTEIEDIIANDNDLVNNINLSGNYSLLKGDDKTDILKELENKNFQTAAEVEDAFLQKLGELIKNGIDTKGSVTVMPSDDTYVINTSAGDSYGNAVEVISCETVSSAGAYDSYEEKKQISEIYMKFDLSPVKDKIVGVKINTYIQNYVTTTAQMYAVNEDSWTGSSMNWENRAVRESLLAAVSLTNSSSTDDFKLVQWESPALTQYISDEQIKDGIASIAVKRMNEKTDNAQGIRIKSLEYTQKPELITTMTLITEKGSVTADKIEFSKNRIPVTTLSSGTVTVKSELTNTKGINQNAAIIAALYNGKRMAGIISGNNAVIPKFVGKKTLSAVIDVPSVSDDTFLKVFLWDSLNNMSPLTHPAYFDKNGAVNPNADSQNLINTDINAIKMNNPEFVVDELKNTIVRLSGKVKSGENQKVSCQILKPDAFIGDVSGLHMINQEISGKDGEFLFEFLFSSTDKSGNYAYYIGINDGMKIGPFYIAKYSSPVLQNFVNTFISKNAGEILQLISQDIEFANQLMFTGVSLEKFNNLPEEKRMAVLSSALAMKNSLTIDNLGDIINEYMVLEEVNKASAASIHSVLLFYNDILKLQMSEGSFYYELNNGKSVENIDNEMEGKIYVNLTEIRNDFNDLLYKERVRALLADIQNANYSKIQTAIIHNIDLFTNINLNGDYKALSDVNKVNVWKALVGKGFRTVYELEVSFNTAVGSFKNNNGTIGTGGGTGGGSGSSGSQIYKDDYPVLPDSKPNIPLYYNSIEFPDVGSEFSWALSAVDNLSGRGIIIGDENGNFNPDKSVKREEFIKMLISAFGLEGFPAVCSFSDVSENEWYSSYIAAAEKLGIVTGFDGRFGVGNEISRQDMATMVHRTVNRLGLSFNYINEPVLFSDNSEIADYAKESVELLQRAGILNGMDDNSFLPKSSANRAQAAALIHRIIDFYCDSN